MSSIKAGDAEEMRKEARGFEGFSTHLQERAASGKQTPFTVTFAVFIDKVSRYFGHSGRKLGNLLYHALDLPTTAQQAAAAETPERQATVLQKIGMKEPLAPLPVGVHATPAPPLSSGTSATATKEDDADDDDADGDGSDDAAASATSGGAKISDAPAPQVSQMDDAEHLPKSHDDLPVDAKLLDLTLHQNLLTAVEQRLPNLATVVGNVPNQSHIAAMAALCVWHFPEPGMAKNKRA